MKLIDNVNEILQEDLKKELNKGTKISIVAASFSIYAFRELAKELGQVEELNFVFNQEMFTDKANPEEADLYGTEFETRLRNDLLQQKLAKECADWIREKVHFKSNVSGKEMPGFITADETSYSEIKKFTTVDLGIRKGNMTYYPIHKTNTSENGRYFVGLFDEIWDDEEKLQDVTDEVLRRITALYSENSPEFIYFLILYNIFSEFLEDVTEDELPNEATGFKESKIWNTLYQFQKDAAIALVNKLEKYNGCILADSVGLGKTFTALAVVKYYESRNKSVLVLCPKKLAENWNTYKSNYVNNPLAEDRLRYDVLFHTDLSRDHGLSNGIDLGRINWGNYDLVVIDESHNFRNGVGTHSNSVDNRYKRLMDNVIKAGVKTKVLMLSATPVNNRFYDLRNQLALGVNAMKAKKHLYDHIVYDSTNERDFATDLDTNSDVAVYVKLPDGFYISTPVGHYNPDWAIAFYEGNVKHIYFVAETKGSMNSMQLRLIEESKIHCAREHFKAISNGNVVYDVVDSYKSLLEKVMK